MREALATSWPLEAIILEDNWQGLYNEFPEPLSSWVEAADLGRISSQQQPEGVIAIGRMPASPAQGSLDSLPETGGFLLWEIRDPGNMGTIMRTADWFGLPNVYLTPNCVEIWNPKVVRASMGSLFRVNPISLTQPMECLNRFAERFWVADLEGESARDCQFPTDSIFVIGSESHGIPAEIAMIPGLQTVHIPNFGGGESLNAAMSATALAWQLRLQEGRSHGVAPG